MENATRFLRDYASGRQSNPSCAAMTALDPARLTKSAKIALMQMNGTWQTLDMIGPFTSVSSMKSLVARGLAIKSYSVRPVTYSATNVGLAVREILKEKNDG